VAILAAELFPSHQLKVVQLRCFDNAESFHQYLLSVEKILQRAEDHKDFRFRYIARDLPLFYFLGDSTTLKHKFRLWSGQAAHQMEMLSSESLTLSKMLFKRYLQLPTEELWFEGAFTSQYQQLDALELNEEIDPAEANDIRAYIKWIEKQQLQWRKRERKSEGGELLLANNPMLHSNNGALLQCGDQEQLFGGIMNAHYFYSHNPELISQFNAQWKQLLKWSKEPPQRMLHRQLLSEETHRNRMQ
jgi:hypothetical protein